MSQKKYLKGEAGVGIGLFLSPILDETAWGWGCVTTKREAKEGGSGSVKLRGGEVREGRTPALKFSRSGRDRGGTKESGGKKIRGEKGGERKGGCLRGNDDTRRL